MYISEKTSTGKTKKLTVFTDYKTGEQYTVDPATKERKYRSPEEVEAKAKIKGRTQWTTKMAEAEDAYKLTSGGLKKIQATLWREYMLITLTNRRPWLT